MLHWAWQLTRAASERVLGAATMFWRTSTSGVKRPRGPKASAVGAVNNVTVCPALILVLNLTLTMTETLVLNPDLQMTLLRQAGHSGRR